MNRTATCLNHHPSGPLQRGFTLTELLVVFVIVGVLASMAIPSYQSYQIRTNRSAAAQMLLNIQSREEQYILDARAYTDVLGSAGLNIVQETFTCTPASATTCSNNHYTVSVNVPSPQTTPPSFTVTATPKTTSINKNDGNLTLTSAGIRARTAGDGKW